VERAGSAVELRPAPKARNAAHPQERQHSAAEGGTRDRVRPAGALRERRVARLGCLRRDPGRAEPEAPRVASPYARHCRTVQIVGLLNGTCGRICRPSQ
jgi:hypothetical protein